MINNDYIDQFVHGYVARQRIDDLHREAEQRRILKEYRAAHPEQRVAAKLARVLRRMADRLAPEQAGMIKPQAIRSGTVTRPVGSR